MAQLKDLWTPNQLRVLRGLDIPTWVSTQGNTPQLSTTKATPTVTPTATQLAPTPSLPETTSLPEPQSPTIKLDSQTSAPAQPSAPPTQLEGTVNKTVLMGVHPPVQDMPYSVLMQAMSSCTLCQYSMQGQRLGSQPALPVQGGCLVILDVNYSTPSTLLSDQARTLLDAMLASLDYPDSSKILLTSALKCKPKNQTIDPIGDEVMACAPYLERQIVLMQPTLILALGEGAAQAIMGLDVPMDDLRGEIHTFECEGYSGQLLVSYHPEQALQTPSLKRSIWQDWCLVLANKTL